MGALGFVAASTCATVLPGGAGGLADGEAHAAITSTPPAKPRNTHTWNTLFIGVD
jgi:hypothetical protein